MQIVWYLDYFSVLNVRKGDLVTVKIDKQTVHNFLFFTFEIDLTNRNSPKLFCHSLNNCFTRMEFLSNGPAVSSSKTLEILASSALLNLSKSEE